MTKDVIKISSCQFCKSEDLVKVLDFGLTPPANAFLRSDQLRKKEKKFPLQVYLCKNCHLLQLGHIVNPKILFKEYVYTSSTSPIFVKHFQDYAESIFNQFKLDQNSLVIDIGSNDGILLKPFRSLGTRVLGIDPAENLAQLATIDGIPTLPRFFDSTLANEILNSAGQADIITANNVFAHIRDLDEIVKGVFTLLKDQGVFIFEVAYLEDFIEKNYFDTVYHEHLFYHAVSPLDKFFNIHDMKIFNVEKVATHGGSIRVFVKKSKAKYVIKNSVQDLIRDEGKKRLGEVKTYSEYYKKILNNKYSLLQLLKKIKGQGKTIAGYGAPAKGNTLLNFFGINIKYLDFIIDDSPLKQGLYTPGTHIPVVSLDHISKVKKPDYILILAWNFAESIIQKLSNFEEDGGKFIIPVPEPLETSTGKNIGKDIVKNDLNHIVKALGKDVHKLEGKTLLISGGSGFLGSYINQTINFLNESVFTKKCKVISIDNYITGSERRNFLGEITSNKFDFTSTM